MKDLINKIALIDKNIENRTRSELLVSLFGIIIFGYFFYEIPFLLTKFACILSIVLLICIIHRLKSTHKLRSRIGLATSVKEQLKHQKYYLTEQSKLLDNVFYWYVLPPFIMNIVFIIGLGDPSEINWTSSLTEYLPITINEKFKTILTLVIIHGLVVLLNKSDVRINFKPVIQDIEKMQEQLKKEN